MEVRPLLCWLISVTSALIGALAGILFEGVLDKFFYVNTEVISSVTAAVLSAVFVGLVLLIGYRLILYMRK